MQDSGSAEKDDRPLQDSGELRVLSNGANNGALNEKDEYSDGSGSEGLEGEEGEEDEYSDEEECSSQHSVAEYNDVAEEGDASEVDEQSSQHSVAEYNDMIASGPEADATEEAEKKEPPEIGSKVDGEDHGSPDPTNPNPVCGSQHEVGDAEGDEQSSQHSVAEHYGAVTSGVDPASPVSDSREEVRDAEVDEHSSHHSTAEYHDVMGSEATADANEEAEKNESLEIASKDGEDHAANPDPVSDSHEEVRDAEVDEHSSHHSTAEYHDVMGSEATADANEEAEKNESLEIASKDGEDHAANPDPVSDSQEEVRDAEVDEHSSHHSTAEYHDVMGSEAAADANEEAEKNESLEITSKVDGEDHAASPDPVSDSQEEVRDAEVDEHSSHHSAEYHDVMGSEAEADDASGPKEGAEKEEPADITSNVEHDGGYPEATSGTSHSAQSHLPQVFDIGSPKADEPGAEEATDEAAAAAEEEPAVGLIVCRVALL